MVKCRIVAPGKRTLRCRMSRVPSMGEWITLPDSPQRFVVSNVHHFPCSIRRKEEQPSVVIYVAPAIFYHEAVLSDEDIVYPCPT
jgi:hypothetical protein